MIHLKLYHLLQVLDERQLGLILGEDSEHLVPADRRTTV